MPAKKKRKSKYIKKKGRLYKRSYKTSWYRPRGTKQTDKSNNNYRNGVSNYRKRTLKKSGSKCQKCGKKMPARKLDVHHKDHKFKNHSGKNLITVCRSCHRLSEAYKRRKKKR